VGDGGVVIPPAIYKISLDCSHQEHITWRGHDPLGAKSTDLEALGSVDNDRALHTRWPSKCYQQGCFAPNNQILASASEDEAIMYGDLHSLVYGLCT
jgi:hypothetical protein